MFVSIAWAMPQPLPEFKDSDSDPEITFLVYRDCVVPLHKKQLKDFKAIVDFIAVKCNIGVDNEAILP